VYQAHVHGSRARPRLRSDCTIDQTTACSKGNADRLADSSCFSVICGS